MPNRGGRFSRVVRSRQGALGLMVLGVLLIAAGLLQTTTSQLDGGNVPCPDGTTLVAKFNFQGGKYEFETPAGNEDVVTITNGSATGGTWDSQIAITYVIVKGGSDAVITSFTPPTLHGVFSNAGLPLVGSGNGPDVSNVQFCAPTASSTTTSTAPLSTTTMHATTTTTTTPTAPTTVTTVAPTTIPTTTTTHASAATTTVPSSTTSPPPTEPTTIPTAGSTVEGATSTLPGSTTPRTVFANGVTSTTIVSVAADTGTGSNSLPKTGSPSLPLIAFGTLLLAAGAALVIVGRRRHWA